MISEPASIDAQIAASSAIPSSPSIRADLRNSLIAAAKAATGPTALASLGSNASRGVVWSAALAPAATPSMCRIG